MSTTRVTWLLGLMSVLVLGGAFAQTDPPDADRYLVELKTGAFVPREDVSRFAESGARFGALQFYELPDERHHRRLARAGIVLKDCIPNHTYLVFLEKRLRPEVLRRLGVRAAFQLPARSKLSPSLGRPVDVSRTGDDSGEVEVRVLYFREAADQRGHPRPAAVLRKLGAEILDHSRPFETVTIRIARSALRRLAHLNWVRWVEEVPPPRVTFNDVSRAEIQVEEVQALPFGLTGSNVKLGIWDEGMVDDAHPDFAGRLTLMENAAVADHSTHVAGTMAGDGAASGGQYRGMAPRAEIYSWSAFEGDPFPEMLDGVEDVGVAVSQNSWGSLPFCEDRGAYHLDSRYEDQLVAFRGLNVVFAAGNLRDNQFFQLYQFCGIDFNNFFRSLPVESSAKNSITVGSVSRLDGVTMSEFSGWGPTEDGRIKPDVVAVGGQGAVGPGCADGVVSAEPGGGYITGCGTSMSTPAVSGTLALLIERYRQEPYIIDPTALPPPDLLKAILLNTATDLGTPGPDYRFGYGKVNALAAVGALDQKAFRRGLVSQGEVQETKITVHTNAGQPCDIQILMNYSDAPAQPAASPTLVNDLDLELFSPDNVKHSPFRLDPDDPEAPAVPSENHPTGPVEQIRLESAQGGEWIIRVSGVEVMKRVQSYTVTWLGEGCRIEAGPEI